MTCFQSSSEIRIIRLSRVMPAFATTFQRSSPNASSVCADQIGGGGRIGDVAADRDGLTAGGPDLRHDLVRRVGPQGVVHADARARRRKLEADGAADATRPARSRASHDLRVPSRSSLQLCQTHGRRYRQDLERPVDPPDEAAQDGSWPDLDEARHAERHEGADRLGESYRCRSAGAPGSTESRRRARRRRSRSTGTGSPGSAKRTAATAGANRCSACAVSGRVEPAGDVEPHRAPGAGGLCGGHERDDARLRPGDDDLAGAVEVRRPDPRQTFAEGLDRVVVEADDGGHGTGREGCGLGHCEAPLAYEHGGLLDRDRPGSAEGGELAHRVTDDEVGLVTGLADGREARKLGRDERRLGSFGGRELFQRTRRKRGARRPSRRPRTRAGRPRGPRARSGRRRLPSRPPARPGRESRTRRSTRHRRSGPLARPSRAGRRPR